jgi:phosphatidylethanolamine N-methyltransferase
MSEWTGTEKGSQEARVIGRVKFEGSRLPWEVGVYHFRYHHNHKHGVVAISQAFDINGSHSLHFLSSILTL